MRSKASKAPEGLSEAPAQRRSQSAAASSGHLEWVVWPARTHLLSGAVVLAFIAALSLAVCFAMESRLYAAICFATLLVAVSPYYLPTRYTLDREGVGVISLLGRRERPWGAFKVYFPDGARGVLLSPTVRYGLPARTRGIYLPFQGNQEQVMALVEARLPEGKVR